MLTNTIIFLIFLFSIFFALNISDNSKVKILLIIFSLVFILLFISLLFYGDLFLKFGNNLNVNIFSLLITFCMNFIIILSIYTIRELQYLKQNITIISRKISYKEYKKNIKK